MIEIKRKPQQPAGRAETPLEVFEGAGAISNAQAARSAQKRQLKPFTALDSTRNYRAMYRAACDFHERHNPPRLDNDRGAAYWAETSDDINRTAAQYENDPFLTSLLLAIFGELENEFKRLCGDK